MVPTATYYPDRSYIFAFILSARLFIKPHELLSQICDISYQQQNNLTYEKNSSNSNENTSLINLKLFIKKFLQLLFEWIETFPYDFRDERVMYHVRFITQKFIAIDNTYSKEVSLLLQNLFQRLKTLESYEEYLERLPSEMSECMSSSSSSNTTTRGGNFHVLNGSTSGSTASGGSSTAANFNMHNDIIELCAQPAILAYQLTHIELERLSYIGPEEFVQAFAKDNPNVDTTMKDMKKTRNLESYVHWFNRLSYLVATEIVKVSFSLTIIIRKC